MMTGAYTTLWRGLAVIAVLILLSQLSSTGPAAAQPFERLPDGRIEVEIFRQKVGLPAKTRTDLEGIVFYPQAGTYTRTTTFKLSEALYDPDTAQQKFDAERNWVEIRISSNQPGEDSPVLGRFDRRSSMPITKASTSPAKP